MDGLNRSYLVTGASSGIGKAFVRSLSGMSAKVTVIVRDLIKTQKALEGCDFAELRLIRCDLSSERELAVLGNDLFSDGFYPDAFLHAAGSAIALTAKKASLEKNAKIMNVNFMSFVVILRALLRRQPVNRELRVLAISSKGAHCPIPGNGIYAASKAALESFVACAASENPISRLKINALAPGWVDTPMAHDSLMALQHPDFDTWLRSGPQPEGLIPAERVVEIIHDFFDVRGGQATGSVFEI